MVRLDDRTVGLSDAEEVVYEWFQALLDEGLGLYEAADHIAGSVPEGGVADKLLKNTEFYYWLVGDPS